MWLAGSRAQAQSLWWTRLVAPWHVGSSQTRARTCVPYVGRWILNHCATREVPIMAFVNVLQLDKSKIFSIIILFASQQHWTAVTTLSETLSSLGACIHPLSLLLFSWFICYIISCTFPVLFFGCSSLAHSLNISMLPLPPLTLLP